MKILVLEDDPQRHKVFKRNLIGSEYKIVETAEDCIACLKESSWSVLFLDHDLGGKQMVESGPGTGYEVAEWISKNPDQGPNEIVLHTFNPSGAKNMQRVLGDVPWLPGCWSGIRVKDGKLFIDLR